MFGCGVKEFTSNEYGDDDDDDEQPLCLALVTHNIRHKLMKKITVNCLESGEIILRMLNLQHWQRQRILFLIPDSVLQTNLKQPAASPLVHAYDALTRL